jgi:hypothetical protein
MFVESLALAGSDPPPVTVTWLLNGEPAAADTFTVKLM